MVAARTDRGGRYLGRHDPSLLKLLAADGPEIEMSRLDLFSMKLFRKLIMEMHKLSATWPQGRADGSYEVARVGAKISGHPPNSFSDDVGHTPSPTGMDIGHDPPLRVMEDHRLTIGLLDQETDAWLIGDQGIVTRMFAIHRRRLSNGEYPVFMHLPS